MFGYADARHPVADGERGERLAVPLEQFVEQGAPGQVRQARQTSSAAEPS